MDPINADFAAWLAAGFKPHPIIPPGAETVAPEGKKPPEAGKTPGLLRSDGTWTAIRWHALTSEMIEKDKRFAQSLEQGAGIGVRGGEGHVFVDCDLMDPVLSMSFAEMTASILGDAPMREGRRPKWAAVYRVEEERVATRVLALANASTGDKVGQIELIGAGRQIVVQGTHKDTLRPYAWNRSPLVPGAVPSVTAEQLAAWLQQVPLWAAENGLTTRGGASDPTRAEAPPVPPEDLVWPGSPAHLLRVVNAAPHPSNTSRDTWINVGMALKAALPKDPARAFRVWLQWSLRWEPEGDSQPNTEAECRSRWKGFHADRLGWRYLASVFGDPVMLGEEAKQIFDAAGDPPPPPPPPPPKADDGHLDKSQRALLALLTTLKPGGLAPRDARLVTAAAGYLARRLSGRLTHLPHANELVFVWEDRWHRLAVPRVSPCLFQWAQDYADAFFPGEGLRMQRIRDTLKEGLVSGKGVAALLAALPADGADTFDSDVSVLNTPGGLVDLRTGEMRALTANDRVRFETRVTPAPGPTPKFDELLTRVTAGMGAAGPEHVQIMFGSALLGNPQQRFWVIRGPSGNGKSTLTRVLELILGDYAAACRADFLTAAAEPPYVWASWKGLRFINFGEAPTGRVRLRADRVKALASHDTVKARHAYGLGWVSYTMHALPALCSNHTPTFDSEAGDEAVSLRLEQTADPKGLGAGGLRSGAAQADYPDRLVEEEGPAVLAWAIEGAKKVAVGAFADGEKAATVQRILRFQAAANSDIVGAWLKFFCVPDPTEDAANEVRVAALSSLMQAWVEEHRPDDAASLVPLVTDAARVGRALRSLGFPRGRSATRERFAVTYLKPRALAPDADPRVEAGHVLGWRAWNATVRGKVEAPGAVLWGSEEVMS